MAVAVAAAGLRNGRFERDSRRFYAIARGLALECAAILDAFEALGFVPASELTTRRELLEPVVSTLNGVIRAERLGR